MVLWIRNLFHKIRLKRLKMGVYIAVFSCGCQPLTFPCEFQQSAYRSGVTRYIIVASRRVHGISYGWQNTKMTIYFQYCLSDIYENFHGRRRMFHSTREEHLCASWNRVLFLTYQLNIVMSCSPLLKWCVSSYFVYAVVVLTMTGRREPLDVIGRLASAMLLAAPRLPKCVWGGL